MKRNKILVFFTFITGFLIFSTPVMSNLNSTDIVTNVDYEEKIIFNDITQIEGKEKKFEDDVCIPCLELHNFKFPIITSGLFMPVLWFLCYIFSYITFRNCLDAYPPEDGHLCVEYLEQDLEICNNIFLP